MASPIDQDLDALAEDFELLGEFEEQIQYMIDLGRTLEPLSEAEHNDANKVRGCASQVWLVTEPQGDGTVRFRGDSDAHLVKGLIAVLLRLFSGRRAEDILAFDVKAGLERLGLASMLTPQRSNGLASMVSRIRSDAERLTR
ncbi:MAG TPA: SufE family protein [Caulobacteraceae bacterium]|nr:SufE family protein [Caulobacteraceae bacterium]